MEIDIKKLSPVTKDHAEAIKHINSFGVQLLDAIHIMQYALKFPEDMQGTRLKNRMSEFIQQFEK